MKKIDLHIHTNISDGDYTPIEVIDKASEAGIDIMTISDHDTVEAYKKFDLFSYARSKEITLVPGIEISTRDNDGFKYHILGLFIDVNNEALIKTIKKLQESRKEYVLKSCNLFKNTGYVFDIESILREEVVTKAHIADYILKNDTNLAQLEKDFDKKPTRGNFIETFMLKNQKCFVDQANFTPKNAIEVIKKASGVAILAHPAFNVLHGQSFDEITKKFKGWKIDGFEAYNFQYLMKDGVKIKEFSMMDDFKKFCLKEDLLISGGSDFHTDKIDKIGPSIQLGDERVSIPEEFFEKMKQVSLERKRNIQEK